MQGMRALFKSLKQAYHYNHLHLVMGVMKDKNYRAIIQYALDFSDSVYFVEPAVHRALKGDVLKESMPNAKRKIVFYDSVERGLPHIIKCAQPNDMICVTGSIYTISEAKRYSGCGDRVWPTGYSRSRFRNNFLRGKAVRDD